MGDRGVPLHTATFQMHAMGQSLRQFDCPIHMAPYWWMSASKSALTLSKKGEFLEVSRFFCMVGARQESINRLKALITKDSKKFGF